MSETYAFQAEINQLLSLIINTFYSNKDIFLRELISNASDALDKVRYESITNAESADAKAISAGDLKIMVSTDVEKQELVIADNGIGMSKDDLIKNLGTIAHSGTRGFMEALKDGAGDMSLIGQFGVGFYSAFLVADKVQVISRAFGSDEAWVWESAAGGSFTLSALPSTEDSVPFQRGTYVRLHIKDDMTQYLGEDKIREIITKHSQYVGFPIHQQVMREEVVTVEDQEDVDKFEDAQDTKDAEDESGDVKDTEEGTVEDVKEGAPKKEEKRIVPKWEHINKQQPIWMRKPEDVTPEEYASFYKSISGDWEEHLAVKHFSAEGQVEFKSLLYIPARPPHDMFAGGINKKMSNIKLYVRKVLIMDETNEMLPEYLSFVKGIVDSNDLPLNVSREMLQQNMIMKVIKKGLVNKVIELMTGLAEGDDTEKWKKFYSAFSKNIKLGIVEDNKVRPKLIELLRFNTSKGGSEDLRSLKEYVASMKEGQEHVYFVTGETFASVSSMPCLEAIKKKGFEVIFMTDPMDEYIVQHINEYNGKLLVNCTKEGFFLDKLDAGVQEDWKETCKLIQESLKDTVKEVRISDKLVSRPCFVVSDQYGWSANMERIMKAQALRGGQDTFSFLAGAKKILEINVSHPLIKALKVKVDACVAADENNADFKSVKKVTELLYETAMLDSGFSLQNLSKYCPKIYNLINLGLSGDAEDTEDTNDADTEDTNNTNTNTNTSTSTELQCEGDDTPPSLMEEID